MLFRSKLQDNCSLNSIKLNHPGGSVGYKLVHGDKSFVYFCDNEFEEEQRKALATFAGKADLLIWDGMFTQKELATKKGWGHSSIEQAIDFNKDANCKTCTNNFQYLIAKEESKLIQFCGSGRYQVWGKEKNLSSLKEQLSRIDEVVEDGKIGRAHV